MMLRKSIRRRFEGKKSKCQGNSLLKENKGKIGMYVEFYAPSRTGQPWHFFSLILSRNPPSQSSNQPNRFSTHEMMLSRCGSATS